MFYAELFRFYDRYHICLCPPTLSSLLCTIMPYIRTPLYLCFYAFLCPICPKPVYATSVIFHSAICLCFYSCALYFVSHLLYTPCDGLRLLRLTGDSQYLSRGEMMSTRARQPRKSTKTLFPRPSPRSHNSPTHRTAAATFLVRSRLFYYTLQHSYIHRPLSEHPPSLPSQLAHPVRRCANICHVVIFRRPPYVPAPPSLRLTHFIPHLLRIYVPDHSLHFMPYAHIHSTYKL